MTEMTQLFSSRELQSLQAEASTPPYFQLFSLLKNRILNGSIPHGERMLTEEELVKGFNVSRITAKRALDDLAAAELVERWRGKQLPPGDVAAEMGLDRGELAHRAVRIRCTEDDVPFGHLSSWTVGIKRGYTKRDLEKRVRLDILKENGIEIAKVEQIVTAVPALDFFAEALDMDIGEPALLMVRRAYDAGNPLVDILYCHHNPRRFHFRLELDAESYRQA